MSRAAVILLTLLAGLLWPGQPSALAQDELDRALVAAATTNALASLRSDVLAARITPDLTVAQFIAKTQSPVELDQALQRCQQIGGPRVVDDQMVQVRLEISGTRVATTLVNIAAAYPHLSPMNAAELDRRLATLKERTFIGTGTSVSAERIQGYRPAGLSDVWSAVSDEQRVQTLAAAREDAARSLIGSIRPIELSAGRTVGDALADPATQTRLQAWLDERPVTKLRYTDDLEIELTIATPPQQVLQTVLESARIQPDDAAMQRLRDEFTRRVTDAAGRAKVGVAPVAQVQRTAATLPAQPPEWVWGPLDVETIAPASNSPLRTKLTAESRAAESLRTKVGALRLDPATTLDDLARQDQRLADAVNRVLLRDAKVYKVEYRADGSVMVRMTIDPRALWSELRMATE